MVAVLRVSVVGVAFRRCTIGIGIVTWHLGPVPLAERIRWVADSPLTAIGLMDRMFVSEAQDAVTREVVSLIGRSDLDGGGLDADEAAILLGYEIGQAQMARSQGLRRILITPVIPILGIQRGQYITAPVLSWKSHGAGLIMSSNTVETELRIDGWGLTISADGNGFEVASDPIDCVEVDV